MYVFSSKSGSEPFRELGDLTWNDPFVKVQPHTILLSSRHINKLIYDETFSSTV